MKKIEKWMDIAANNPIAQNYIPLGYQPTLPLLLEGEGGYQLGLYYYHMEMSEEGVSLKSPRYLLFFDMKTEKPVLFQDDKYAEKSLGCCKDIFEEEFSEKQMKYIEKFEKALNDIFRLTMEDLEEVFELWLDTVPSLLKDGFE